MTEREQELESFAEMFLQKVRDQKIANNSWEGGDLESLVSFAESCLSMETEDEEAT